MTPLQKENDRKLKQKQETLLGETFNSCRGKLMKIILFNLVKKVGLDICHKCDKKIEEVEELSVEHKIPWMNSRNPRETFFDLENIAFSHLRCNKRTEAICGSRAKYLKGCRCPDCIEAESKYSKNYRKSKPKNK